MALGMLVKGKWITERNDQDQNGKFHEKPTTFRDRITADGSSGFKAEAGSCYSRDWQHVLARGRHLQNGNRSNGGSRP